MKVRTRFGWQEVESPHPNAAPGLIAHRSLLPARGWTLTHKSSGRAVKQGLHTLREASQLALLLASLTDWTQPGAKIVKVPNIATQVREAARTVRFPPQLSH